LNAEGKAFYDQAVHYKLPFRVQAGFCSYKLPVPCYDEMNNVRIDR